MESKGNGYPNDGCIGQQLLCSSFLYCICLGNPLLKGRPLLQVFPGPGLD